jgi:hypothetical protein
MLKAYNLKINCKSIKIFNSFLIKLRACHCLCHQANVKAEREGRLRQKIKKKSKLLSLKLMSSKIILKFTLTAKPSVTFF